MKLFVGLLGVVLVVVTGWFVYTWVSVPNESIPVVYTEEIFVFADSEAQQLVVQYDESGEFALVLFNNNEYELMLVASESGARYESRNGLVVFTQQLGQGQLELGGEVVIAGGLLEGSEAIAVIEERMIDGESIAIDTIKVVNVPVLGQRCVDSVTVDCAELEAAANVR